MRLLMNALEWFTDLFRRKPRRPPYCDLLVEVVALFIFARRQPSTTAEQSALLRTLISAAQHIMEPDEWVEVRIKANTLLKRTPSIIGAWLDARDSLNVRLGVDDEP